MTNIVAIRLFRKDFGDILDVVETLRKISTRTIITEEMTPYQHYHILIYTDKNEKQIAKYIQNHKIKGVERIRQRNNSYAKNVQNENAYIEYIKKNFVRGFDTCKGWLTCGYEYKEYQFPDDKPDHIDNVSKIIMK